MNGPRRSIARRRRSAPWMTQEPREEAIFPRTFLRTSFCRALLQSSTCRETPTLSVFYPEMDHEPGARRKRGLRSGRGIDRGASQGEERTEAVTELRRKKKPPEVDHARSRIVEFVSKEVGDQDSLADLKTAGLWGAVRTKHFASRIEAGARSGVLGYWYSRLSYHRPDLVPFYVDAVKRAGYPLPAKPEPIQWLRPALNAFLLSPEALDVSKTLFDSAPPDSFLANLAELSPPPEPKQLAFLSANGFWGRITADELKPTLERALRISQDAVEWLVNWLRFYRLDLMPALRQAAIELDAGRAPRVINEEEELERIDAEWSEFAPKLTAKMLRRLLKTAAAKNIVPTVIERIHRHRPDLISVIAKWRERKLQ